MSKIKGIFIAAVVILLVYTRFLNIGWGLPYHFHPDERNMAVALQQLECEDFSFSAQRLALGDCFNPHFFAYGQLPLYVGYILLQIYYLFSGNFGQSPLFSEAVITLRTISAAASVITVFFLVATVRLLLLQNSKKEKKSYLVAKDKDGGDIFLSLAEPKLLISFLLFTLTPVFIQFAHFGTTESLLMFLYVTLVYVSLLFMLGKIPIKKYTLLSGLICGLAIGTKISSAVFLILPLLVFINSPRLYLSFIARIITITIAVGILSSPHNLISFTEFYQSMRYESKVALGELSVFYTRQFEYSVPILFQFFKIYPASLGYGILLSFIGGFLLLPKTKELNFLRFTFLVAFLPFAFMYAKWTRFIVLTFPIITLTAVFFIFYVKDRIDGIVGSISKIKYQRLNMNIKYQNLMNFLLNSSLIIVIGILCFPGIAYLSIYQTEDVRLQASRWIFANIPDRATILQETANVVDLPLFSPYPDVVRNENKPMPVYKSISFNFYDLDHDRSLSQIFTQAINEADYIIVPSRRIFRNYTCEEVSSDRDGLFERLGVLGYEYDRCEKLQRKFPQLNAYYNKLFKGELGFDIVAQFDSYPTLKISDKTLFEIQDDIAEETWTVFDHPTILIFKKQ